jgi:hypothetical protein
MNLRFIIKQEYTYKSRGGNMVLHVDCKSTDLGFDSLLALDYLVLLYYYLVDPGGSKFITYNY